MGNLGLSAKIILIISHMLLGYVLTEFPQLNLSTIWGMVIIFIGTKYILSMPESNGYIPLYFSAYIVGMEVILRMTDAKLFWEFGKYGILYFLILGVYRQQRHLEIYPQIFYYILLLIPAVFLLPFTPFNQWRQDIAFNLSGPVCLTICSLFTFNRSITVHTLRNILFFLILPILTMSIFNIIMMPDLTTYHFIPYSNPTTSGGFGPNQVSTLFGLGIVCILIMHLFKSNISGSTWVDLLILGLFSTLGFLTFSRGGMFGAVISFTLAGSYYLFKDQKRILIIIKGISLMVVVMISWYFIVSITDGVISQRYGFGETAYGERLLLDFTGRLEIYKIDLQIFLDYFFTGVGPGQANELREIYGYGKNVAAHVEYSRMLAEHGILGLLSLILLLATPFSLFNNTPNSNKKVLIILFGILALITMTHSAMRIAMPCFVFSLIFLTFKE
jgi:hypothetical protein